MNSVLSSCFSGIVTLHSVLDCAVDSALAALHVRILFRIVADSAKVVLELIWASGAVLEHLEAIWGCF